MQLNQHAWPGIDERGKTGLHLLKDFILAVFFLGGSICFLFQALHTVASWFFILGSALLFIDPFSRVIARQRAKRR